MRMLCLNFIRHPRIVQSANSSWQIIITDDLKSKVDFPCIVVTHFHSNFSDLFRYFHCHRFVFFGVSSVWWVFDERKLQPFRLVVGDAPDSVFLILTKSTTIPSTIYQFNMEKVCCPQLLYEHKNAQSIVENWHHFCKFKIFWLHRFIAATIYHKCDQSTDCKLRLRNTSRIFITLKRIERKKMRNNNGFFLFFLCHFAALSFVYIYRVLFWH